MDEEIQMVTEEATSSMQKAIDRLKSELLKVRAGRASANMLDGVMAEAYGAQTPINQLANITVPDPRSITIQPWDKTTIEAIERAIMMANLGLTPQNDGEAVRLNIPPLTEERRKDLVKQTKSLAEDARVSIRNSRRDANDMIKSLEKDGLSEDAAKDAETEIQNLTDQFTDKVEDLLKVKEEEIMTV